MGHGAWALVLLGFGLAAACGGKVVVDRGGAGGDGGASTGTTTTTGNATGGSSQCLGAPKPVGTIDSDTCGGSATSGGASGPQCTTSCSDDAKNIYESSCQGTTCQCKHNGKTICTCALTTPGTKFCVSNVPACCPKPWIDF